MHSLTDVAPHSLTYVVPALALLLLTPPPAACHTTPLTATRCTLQGLWCRTNVNPHKVQLLHDNPSNFSICEQRLNWVGRFKRSLR